MKQKIFTLLALFACVLTASAQGFTVKDVEMVPGSNQYKINLDLNAAATFIGCSFSIALPEGVTPVMTTATLPTDVEGQAATEQQVVKCDLSSDFNGTGTYVFSHQDGDVYKFVVLPTTAPAYLTAGTVMSVYVQGPGEVTFPTTAVLSGEGKNYPVAKNGTAADIVFAYSNGSSVVDLPVPTPIIVNFLTYKLGDANGDAKTNIVDYDAVANTIMGSKPVGFIEIAADVDNNDKINIADYDGVANIILTGSVTGSSSAPAFVNEIEPE